jgi:branched-chain amino acid transport system substrate-binding protein
MKTVLNTRQSLLVFFMATFMLCASNGFAQEKKQPVFIGFDGEIGHLTSTSDDAIIMGISIAIEEINAAGGVLEGRKLKMIVKDNRSVPARGVANIKKFAQISDLIAVVGGKFSSVILAEIPILHEKKMIMLDAWGAADGIIDNGRNPNYCFRLSLSVITKTHGQAFMINHGY